MEFTEEAKKEIEKALKDRLKNISLGEKERGNIEKELRSTYYEAAEAGARSRGASVVTPEDVAAAMADMGSPGETANCIMKSHAGTAKRAGFPPRLVAFVIDYFARVAIMYAILFPLSVLGTPFFNGDIVFFNATILNFPVHVDLLHFSKVSGRSPFEMAILTAIMIIVFMATIAVFLSYSFVLEGRYGTTIGKRIMGLRVLKADCTKIGYQDAFVRNCIKYFVPLLVLDALLMLTILKKEKQRGSDRIADTIVVHDGGQ